MGCVYTHGGQCRWLDDRGVWLMCCTHTCMYGMCVHTWRPVSVAGWSRGAAYVLYPYMYVWDVCTHMVASVGGWMIEGCGLCVVPIHVCMGCVYTHGGQCWRLDDWGVWLMCCTHTCMYGMCVHTWWPVSVAGWSRGVAYVLYPYMYVWDVCTHMAASVGGWMIEGCGLCVVPIHVCVVFLGNYYGERGLMDQSIVISQTFYMKTMMSHFNIVIASLKRKQCCHISTLYLHYSLKRRNNPDNGEKNVYFFESRYTYSTTNLWQFQMKCIQIGYIYSNIK